MRCGAVRSLRDNMTSYPGINDAFKHFPGIDQSIVGRPTGPGASGCLLSDFGDPWVMAA